MRFTPTSLRGAWTIEWEPYSDERGLFARAFCAREFRSQGLCAEFTQANISINPSVGTVRGMHYQRHPHRETKLVRCVSGAAYDVIVDIRPESPTYLHWFGTNLTADNGLMMYVPEGFAHGYQVLMPNTSLFYLVSRPYVKEAEFGVRVDDPAIGITWPLPVAGLSAKDRDWPLRSKLHRGDEAARPNARDIVQE